MTQAFNLSQFANKVNTSGQADLTTAVTGILPIANGGTNNSSLPVTAGGVIYTDGTKQANTGAGTSGYILQANNTSAPTWVAPPVGGLTVVFIDASTTWTKPAGVNNFYVAIHAGGGGGGGDSVSNTGGNGGFGGYAYALLTTGQISATVSITIGSGGTGGSNQAGGAGGASSFGSYLSATGGGGGAIVGTSGANGTGTISTGVNLGLKQVGDLFTLPNPLGMSRNQIKPRGTGTGVAWNINSIYWPGANGQGDISTSNNASGGVGGACIIVY